MVWTDDPVLDAERYYGRLDELEKKIIYPICQDCGEQITDDHCYVMNDSYPMESCICNSCMDKRLKALPEALYEYLSFKTDDAWQETPTERKEC